MILVQDSLMLTAIRYEKGFLALAVYFFGHSSRACCSDSFCDPDSLDQLVVQRQPGAADRTDAYIGQMGRRRRPLHRHPGRGQQQRPEARRGRSLPRRGQLPARSGGRDGIPMFLH